MASIKIIQRKDKEKEDGTRPLTIRITKDRKSSYIHTGYYILENEWDEAKQRVKKSHANSQRLNNLLAKKLSEANSKLLELETDQKLVSSIAVKKEIKSSGGANFLAHSDDYLKKLRLAGEYAQLKPEESRVKRFKEYLNNRDIAMSDITQTLLENYTAWLKGTRDLKDRTIANHLLTIREVFSHAIKQNIRLEKYYPFGKGKLSIKIPSSLKIGLNDDEVRKIEKISLPPLSYMHHARNVWLISFFFAGIRASDVLMLKWSDFKDNRLYYVMNKNGKIGSLKVSDRVSAILAQYADAKDKSDLVFPDLRIIKDFSDKYELQRQTAFVIRRLDKSIKLVAKRAEVDKNISMHISRHTFGNIAGDRIPLQMLQKLYRHSSITTTIGYQANFINQDADDALDAVINS